MIKAINTYYNSNYFRSRLEARWAVFFDLIGLKYEYEPKGFVLTSGKVYLPDFFLSEFNFWVEVKPSVYQFNISEEGEIQIGIHPSDGHNYTRDFDNSKISVSCHPDFDKWVNVGNILILIGNPHSSPIPFITGKKIPIEDSPGEFEPEIKYRAFGETEVIRECATKANKKRFEHGQ